MEVQISPDKSERISYNLAFATDYSARARASERASEPSGSFMVLDSYARHGYSILPEGINIPKPWNIVTQRILGIDAKFLKGQIILA